MKWLKYRRKSSSGKGTWEYKPLYVENVSKRLRLDVREDMEALNDEYSWSEHNRGVQWTIVDHTKVPNKHIDRRLKELPEEIECCQERLCKLKRHLPWLKGIQGSGAIRDPDEEARKRRDRLFLKRRIRQVKEHPEQFTEQYRQELKQKLKETGA